jgi:hypothetical protein
MQKSEDMSYADFKKYIVENGVLDTNQEGSSILDYGKYFTEEVTLGGVKDSEDSSDTTLAIVIIIIIAVILLIAVIVLAFFLYRNQK